MGFVFRAGGGCSSDLLIAKWNDRQQLFPCFTPKRSEITTKRTIQQDNEEEKDTVFVIFTQEDLSQTCPCGLE